MKTYEITFEEIQEICYHYRTTAIRDCVNPVNDEHECNEANCPIVKKLNKTDCIMCLGTGFYGDEQIPCECKKEVEK